jgi:uncharacterized circularly permuted ATP-grasp superfamily protein
MNFGAYQTGDFYDELFRSAETPREEFRMLVERIDSLPEGELLRRQRVAERDLMHMGITFNVYGDERGQERIFPFDLVPRLVTSHEWDWLEKGLQQRVRALNLFIDDVYHDQKNRQRPDHPPGDHPLSPRVPGGVRWSQPTTRDLVPHHRDRHLRDSDGRMYVLEDNLRVPSGVSYVLQNRLVLKRTFPEVFQGLGVRPVDDYPGHLLGMLEDVAPSGRTRAEIVLLTPGPFNSAYFEHSFLAQQMGTELVEGRDLVVVDGSVFMRTTAGLELVDVIYRRINDNFLDPRAFHTDSLIGVPGVMEAYRKGRVTLVNAPGTGVADDKVVYAYVPQIVRYYLDEDIIIPNVPTYLCWDERQREHVLANIENLVVKPANGSGGEGMLVGPHATAKECDEFRDRVRQSPRNYVAQPTLSLSRVPTLIEDHFEGRHVDLRPFILYGRDIYVMPGGLTRVALRKGSLVVNSSQGGGSKDTWVLSPQTFPQTGSRDASP